MAQSRTTSTRKRSPRAGSWICHTCGDLFRAYAPIERHVDGHGGGRIECVIVLRARS